MSIPDSPYPSRKALKALRAIDALSPQGYCATPQEEIAATAGMSVRHLRRAIRELEELGWLATRQRYLVGRHRTQNTYQVIHRPAGVTGQKESGHSRPTGQKESGHSRPTGQKESGHGGQKESAMNHELMNHENNLKTVDNLLHWIDNPKRRELAGLAHVTPEYAQRFTSYYYQGIFPAHVDVEHIVGYLITVMENGDAPPPAQMELPAGVWPEHFTSRGQSRAEAEAEHRRRRGLDDGAHLTDEGFIR